MVGNLCADPELRQAPGKVPVAELRLAENRYRKDVEGEWQTETSFYTVTCWRDLATHAAECLHRGDRIVVVGRMRQDTWTTETGESRSRYLVDADDLAASLRFATLQVTKTNPRSQPAESREYGPEDPERPFEDPS